MLASADSAERGTDGREFAVFDPCAARTRPGAMEAVRTLARREGISVEELSEKNRCCGFGGHMNSADPELYENVIAARTSASDAPYLVYCANCEDAFLRQCKECAHILDIVLSGAPCPSQDEAGAETGDISRTPHLQEKRERTLALKRALSSIYDRTGEGESVQRLARQLTENVATDIMNESIEVRIPDDVRAHMDATLILDDDVAATILAAEESGDKFTESEGGVSLACLVTPTVTYWVEYLQVDDGSYDVYNVYSHRMRFEAD
jgi:hypothetical protein